MLKRKTCIVTNRDGHELARYPVVADSGDLEFAYEIIRDKAVKSHPGCYYFCDRSEGVELYATGGNDASA